MSTLVAVQEQPGAWEAPPAAPLDQKVWQAWVAKGRAQDRRISEVGLKTVKVVSAVALIVAVGVGIYLPPYDVVVRFIVAAGAIAIMLQAFRTRHYVLTGLFGALALLYNPVSPIFSFSSDWQRILVAASAIPFLASLAWRTND